MTTSTIIILCSVIIVILIAVFFIRKNSRYHNVTRLSSFKSSKSALKQSCSYCKRKAASLAFYSDEQGKVIGVCKDCKAQAERRALMRL